MIFVFSLWLIQLCHLIIIFSVCNSQRKIIGGHDVSSDHRHMVYLITAEEGMDRYSGWLCGGSLVHKRIAITSAACVRDFEFMYLVAGYNRYVADDQRNEDECISKMKRKVIHVCVPKDYKLNYTAVYEWAKLDIAVVKVDADVTGVKAYAQYCHYVPKSIQINYDNLELQKSGKEGLLLGWGHTKLYRGTKEFMNKKILQYASTRIYDKRKCIQKYKEFHVDALIEKYMICTWPPAPFNDQGDDQLSDIEQDVKYKSNEGREACSGETKVAVEDKGASKSQEWEKDKVGICQNDHGGPLVAWQRSNPIIIGVASAFATNENDECEGPFLFTSTYCNSRFLKCSIYELSKDDKPKSTEQNNRNDDKPYDYELNDDKPNYDEPNDYKPNDDQPNDDEPNDYGPNDDKPNDDEPNDYEPNYDKPNDDEPNDYKPNNHKPNNHKPNNDKPNNHKPNNHKPNNHKPNNHKPNNHKPNNHKPNNHKPNNHKPNNHKPNNHKPNNHKPNNHKPNYHKPNNHKPIINKLPDMVSKNYLLKFKNKVVKYTDKNHKPKDDRPKLQNTLLTKNSVTYHVYTYIDDLEKNVHLEIEIDGVGYDVEFDKEEITRNTQIPKDIMTFTVDDIGYVFKTIKKGDVRRSIPFFCMQSPEEKGFEIIERQISWLKHPDGPAENEKYHVRPQRPLYYQST